MHFGELQKTYGKWPHQTLPPPLHMENSICFLQILFESFPKQNFIENFLGDTLVLGTSSPSSQTFPDSSWHGSSQSFTKIIRHKFPPQPLDVTNQLESGSAVQVTQPLLDNPPDVLYRIEVRAVPSLGNNSDFIVTENSPAGEWLMTWGLVLTTKS